MGNRLAGTQQNLEQQNGTWTFLGTISGDGSTAKTSQSTATPFTINPGQRLLLQADVAVYVHATPASKGGAAVTASGTNGLKLPASTPTSTTLYGWQSDLSIISVSGAFSVKVFDLG